MGRIQEVKEKTKEEKILEVKEEGTKEAVQEKMNEEKDDEAESMELIKREMQQKCDEIILYDLYKII